MLGCLILLKNSHSCSNLLIGSLCSLCGNITCCSIGSKSVSCKSLAAQKRSSHSALQTFPYDPIPSGWSLNRNFDLMLLLLFSHWKILTVFVALVDSYTPFMGRSELISHVILNNIIIYASQIISTHFESHSILSYDLAIVYMALLVRNIHV